MRISELASKCGLSTRAIDYYKDLIPCSEEGQDSGSTYRDYGQDAFEVCMKIAILREVGLSLKEIEKNLKDPSYFTTARWNEHIKKLEKNRKVAIAHYDHMIEYAKALRNSKSFVFQIISDINDVNDALKVSKLYSLIIDRVNVLLRKRDEILEQSDDKPNDIALVYLRIDRFFENLVRLYDAGEPYDSKKVQDIVEKFASQLMESYGVVVYCVFDAFKDVQKSEFGYFDAVSEDDYEKLIRGLAICFDWYREAKTIENALNYSDFQTKYQDRIHEYDLLLGESTVDGLQFCIRLISYIPTFIVALVKERSKDAASVEKNNKLFEFGASMVESPSDMQPEDKESLDKITEYLKNTVGYFLREKAKELPEDWKKQLDLDYGGVDDEEAGKEA